MESPVWRMAASTMYAQLAESMWAPVKVGRLMVDGHVMCAWFLVAPDGQAKKQNLWWIPEGVYCGLRVPFMHEVLSM